jgi:DNA-binding transcriptional LysR family regulator
MNRLAAMEAFVRVIDTGSFSGAARQLRIGQPAISKAIAQLEEKTGVQLLVRSTHGLSATEAGQRFYEHARRAIEEAEAADAAARGASAALTGKLRISAAVTFARLHIIPKLARFLDEHPALDIEIVLDDRNVDLIETGIDLALRMGDLTDSTLTARRIAEGRRVVLASPSYVKAHGEPNAPKDLSNHRAVIYDLRGGGSRWVFTRETARETVDLKGRVHMTAAEGVREAVFAGLGLAVSSEWMFSPEMASGKVKVLLPQWQLPPIDLWAITPTGRRTNAKARAFASFVEVELASLNGVSPAPASRRVEKPRAVKR